MYNILYTWNLSINRKPVLRVHQVKIYLYSLLGVIHLLLNLRQSHVSAAL